MSILTKENEMKVCIRRVGILLTMLITLSGCATKSKNTDMQPNKQTVVLTQQEYNQLTEMAHQWQENKASFERLLAYEQALGLLINDLNQMVAKNDKANSLLADTKSIEQKSEQELKTQHIAHSAQGKAIAEAGSEEVVITLFRAAKPVKETHLNESEGAQQVTKMAVPSSSAKFAIQVASVKDKKRAKQVFDSIKKKLSTTSHVLDNAQLEQTKVGTQEFYRLKLGAFKTKQQAKINCELWRKKDISCFVTQFGGLKNSDWL